MKPRKIIRPQSLHLHLPEDVMAKLYIHLFSEVEGRVPMGAYQRFLSARIREYFSRPVQKDHETINRALEILSQRAPDPALALRLTALSNKLKREDDAVS